MNKKSIWRDFISDEKRDFKVRLGYTIASSLFGLICGVVLSSFVWILAFNYVVEAIKNIYLGS